MSRHEMADYKADGPAVKRYERPTVPVIDRIKARVQVTEGGCWLWLGALCHGYGQIQVGSRRDDTRRTLKVHRAAYEAVVGPIPEGLELDHLCRNARCCNPAHLEAVTGQVNAIRRGATQRGVRLCANGLHEIPIRGALATCRPCQGALW